MQTVNIHEAKTQLSRLLEQVVATQDPFIIAKAGKPLVKVMPLLAPDANQERHIGFLAGHIRIPHDFDTMGNAEIAALFGGTNV